MHARGPRQQPQSRSRGSWPLTAEDQKVFDGFDFVSAGMIEEELDGPSPFSVRGRDTTTSIFDPVSSTQKKLA